MQSGQHIKLSVECIQGQATSQLSQRVPAFQSFPARKHVTLKPLPDACGPALHDALKVSLLVDGKCKAHGKGKVALNLPLHSIAERAAQELTAYQAWVAKSDARNGALWALLGDVQPTQLCEWLRRDVTAHADILEASTYERFGVGVKTVEHITAPSVEPVKAQSVAPDATSSAAPASNDSPAAQPTTPRIAQGGAVAANDNVAISEPVHTSTCVSSAEAAAVHTRHEPAASTAAAGAGARRNPLHYPQLQRAHPRASAAFAPHAPADRGTLQARTVTARAHSTAAAPLDAIAFVDTLRGALDGDADAATSAALASLTLSPSKHDAHPSADKLAAAPEAQRGRTVASLRPIIKVQMAQAAGRPLRGAPREGRYRLYRERDLNSDHAYLFEGFSAWMDVSLCHGTVEQRDQRRSELQRRVPTTPGIYEFAAWRPVDKGSAQCFLVPIYLGKAGAFLPTIRTDAESGAHLRQRFCRYLNPGKGRVEPDWYAREERKRRSGRVRADAADGCIHDKNDVFKECQLRGFGIAYRWCECAAPLEPLWLESWLLAQVDYAANDALNGGYRQRVSDVYVSNLPQQRTLADFPRLDRDARLAAAPAQPYDLSKTELLSVTPQAGDAVLAGANI